MDKRTVASAHERIDGLEKDRRYISCRCWVNHCALGHGPNEDGVKLARPRNHYGGKRCVCCNKKLP